MSGKRCFDCGTTHSSRWIEHTIAVEDEYGMACSEPGVSCYITMPVWICKECEMWNEAEEEKYQSSIRKSVL